MSDARALRAQAASHSRRGDAKAAASTLLQALSAVHLPESEYVPILDDLRSAFIGCGDLRGAITVAWYAGGNQEAVAYLVQNGAERLTASDRARSYERLGRLSEAAAEWERGGLLAQAAIAAEKAGQWPSARALWARIAERPPIATDGYQRGLLFYNVARTAKQCRDPKTAQHALGESVRLLDESADHFESIGQRERAFDCFHVLTQVAREGGAFEHTLGGYVNCVRILREDQLRYFALQYFEDAIGKAREANESSAAATLAKEASDYARSAGLSSIATYYTQEQARLWQEAAASLLKRGAPAELAENALLASLQARAELRQFGTVGQVFSQLSQLELEPERKERYARLVSRYASAGEATLIDADLPANIRKAAEVVDVWHEDIREWEQRGDPAEVCADIMLDPHWPELVRRKAMIARLHALNADPPTAANLQWRVELTKQLAQLQLYNVLAPLEAMFRNQEPAVKLAVVAAMGTLFFKRTFVILREALRADDSSLLEPVSTAIEALYFQHAFDPLTRVVREETAIRAKTAAIRAIARIDTKEAAEYLLQLLTHGDDRECGATVDALGRSRGSKFLDLARNEIATLGPRAQAAVKQIATVRGYYL